MLRWMRDPRKQVRKAERRASRHGNPRGFDKPMPTDIDPEPAARDGEEWV